MGVPDFWLEDATQDIALATWRDGKPGDVLAIRREAIDAARRYGNQARGGRRKPSHVPLEAAAQLGEPPDQRFEIMQAVKSVFGSLTPKQRRAIKRRIERLPMSNSDSARASAARRKLRKELAGE
jgi:hypothetical protein